MKLTHLSDAAEKWSSCMKYECEKDPWCYGCFAGQDFCDQKNDLRICERALDAQLRKCRAITPDCWKAIQKKSCDTPDVDVCTLDVEGCNDAMDKLCD